jgi:(p)ppGpp synthase/HD superfamily hydrolase
MIFLENKAKKIATKEHKEQYRKDKKTPYIKHPEEVVKLLKEIGIKNQDIICAAWLHDTIEDCGLTKKFIEKEFNPNIARIVKALTRDVSREEYKKRIKNSDFSVQIIKLADTVHNCKTLHKLLPKKTIKRKIKDCKSLYIPLAKKIEPRFYKLIIKYLKPLQNFS